MAARRRKVPEVRVRAVVYLQPSGKRKLASLATAYGCTQSAIMNQALERMYHAEVLKGHVEKS